MKAEITVERTKLTNVNWLTWILLAAAMIGLAWALGLARPAHAAEDDGTAWLPPRCCDLSTHCVRLAAAGAAQGPAGFAFAHRGRSYLVPYEQAIESQDGHHYACFPKGALKCFAAPKGGF